MNDSNIIKLCKELGCCDACCLRYVGLKSPIAYENAKQYILKYVQDKTEPVNKVDQSTEQDNELKKNETVDARSDTNGSESDEPPSKKKKTDNICVSCIGVLQEENWPQCNTMVKDVLDKKRYECDAFACGLSAPIATMLRERYVTLSLKEHCSDYDEKLLTPLKEAWKWSFGTQLAAHVAMTLDSGAVSPLLVTLHLEYPDELQELEVLKTLAAALFAARSRQRARFAVEFTRRSVEQALRGVALAALRAAGGAPAPRARAAPVSVQASHAPLLLGGRYVKLSRSLPQTPWLVNGLRMMHSSVQEIIFQPIARLYGMSVEETEHRLKFMSAGREDVDVRCLGDGRPFAVEVSDPQRQPTADELRRLCDEISEGEQVVVKSLVPVSKEDLAQLKKGEETKCKTYEALCIKLSHSEDDELTANGDTAVRVTARDLANINSYRSGGGDSGGGDSGGDSRGDGGDSRGDGGGDSGGPRVLLRQRTPIRVLHRRPLLTRTRRIHELAAFPVPDYPQLFVVRLRTEAGTYVKEWAHGEAGRTRPRLADALRARADILALDVASVDLPWPAPPRS